MRKIIHIDMDAFFASIEQRDHSELRGKPVAVGFDGPRGVVSTASYEARKFGVHSAMSIYKAKKLCPQLIIVHTDHEYYRYVSAQVHEIFVRYTDVIEPLSIDEAFLDVTDCQTDLSAVDIAESIRCEIKEKLDLTASAGVSYNKFLAKVASDYNKPDGLFVIEQEHALDFIDGLPIEKFWGVGDKVANMMHKIGVFNGLQLRRCSLGHLIEVFGKVGRTYYDFARGIDNRVVEPLRDRKSIGCERTFVDDISRKSAAIIELYHIVVELSDRLDRYKFKGRTLTLKVKFDDFTSVTRSLTQSSVFENKNDILPLAKRLLTQLGPHIKPIRLIGLSVSNPPDYQRHWVEGYLPFDGETKY